MLNSTHEARRTAGQCISCGRTSETFRCRKCNDKIKDRRKFWMPKKPSEKSRSNAYKRDWRKLKIQYGWCSRCGAEDLIPGKTIGPECQKLISAANRRAYQKRRELGLCTACRVSPAREGKTTCMECALAKSRREALTKQ